MRVIEEKLNQNNIKSSQEAKAIFREMVQQIVLVGLARGGFFKYASFYGGTALRIFYGLNRYSEDLDFTLNEKNLDFCLEKYISKIEEVALSYGLSLKISCKNKIVETPIESAFAKLNTYQTFLTFKVKEDILKTIHKDEVLKVKFEIDCNPALGFNIESKWLDNPEFASISVLDLPSLFAGKLHAVLCRNYKNNIKGRDYYDFLFYIQKGVKPNLVYLKNKLVETSKLKKDDPFDNNILKEMLRKRIEEVDFELVKNDASRFLFKNENLDYYSKDLFLQMVERL